MPGIHVKNRVFEGRLQHKALMEISWKNTREHNFVSIILKVYKENDLGDFLVV
uniref:Uncharacterized protein n=1 Tax=viral metagenome TaxID=1070528 RepID=A0A6C0CT84_9ZZZZ